MNRIFQILLFSVLIIGLNSCEEKIDLELPEGETFLVVEGWITNENNPHFVKLSYTSPYFDERPSPAATGATVFLRDNEGNETELIETIPGTYQFDFGGIIGRSYQLRINLPNGDNYESNYELLRTPVPIDSIYYVLSEREPNSNFDENPDDIYDVVIDTYEPEGLGDHYQWRSFLNGVEAREPIDIFTTSDQLVDGGPIIALNITYKLYSIPDTVEIVQERISKEAYEFIANLQNQTAYVGSPFDTPPVPILGNVRNLSDPKRNALGFFGAAGRDRATVIVGD